MKVYALISATNITTGSGLGLTVAVSFINASMATNSGVTVFFNPAPTDQKIFRNDLALKVSAAVNSIFGLNTTAADMFFL